MSPERHVRTRLYFTSESHVHSLLSTLRYGALCDVSWTLFLLKLCYFERNQKDSINQLKAKLSEVVFFFLRQLIKLLLCPSVEISMPFKVMLGCVGVFSCIWYGLTEIWKGQIIHFFVLRVSCNSSNSSSFKLPFRVLLNSLTGILSRPTYQTPKMLV